MKSFLIYLLFLLIVTGNLIGQAAGDWQTRANGNWNSNTVWQIYSGGWVDATAGQYPSNPISTNITILNGHTVTASGNVDQDYGSGSLLLIASGGILNMGAYRVHGLLFGFIPLVFTDLTVNGTLTTSSEVNAETFNIGSVGHFNTTYGTTGWWNGIIPPTTTDFQGLIEFAGATHEIPDYTYTNIDVSGTASIPSGARTINGVLDVTGSLTNDGTISLGDSLINSGILTSNGVMSITGNAVNSGTLNNNDSIYITGDFQNNVGGSFSNTAPLILSADLSNSATITNTSNILLSGDLTNNVGGQINTQDTIEFDGGLHNNGTIATTAAAVFNFNGPNDTIAGTGTFPSSNLNITVGTVSLADYRITSAQEITAYDFRIGGNDTLKLNPTAKLTVTNNLRIFSQIQLRMHSDASSSASLIANNTPAS